MSQRKRDWNDRRGQRGRGGGGGGPRFPRNEDFRPPQRGRGYGGRPPPFEFRPAPGGRDRYSGDFDFDQPNRQGPALWTRNRRSDGPVNITPAPAPVVNPPPLLATTEPLRPPDLRFIDPDAAWAPFDDASFTDIERSPSPEGRLFANTTDPALDSLLDPVPVPVGIGGDVETTPDR